MGLSKASRLNAVKTAAAMVGLAVVLIGPTACGSDASSDSAKPASAQPKREAGLTMDVRLVVKNATASRTGVMLCEAGSAGNCQFNGTMEPGASAAMAAGEISGNFSCYSCTQVYFRAVNPTVGAPYVALEGSDGDGHGDGNEQKLAPSEGNRALVTIQGSSFAVTRSADSSYKEFELALTAQSK
jgi:hypothetical protein